jgi:hypothetical protein
MPDERIDSPQTPVRTWILGACMGLVFVLVLLGLSTTRVGREKVARTEAFIAMLEGACKQYRERYGTCPPSTSDGNSSALVRALGVPHEGKGGALPPLLVFPADLLATPAGPILDEWGRPLRYLNPGVRNPQGVDLWSTGHDALDPSDDITNWPRPSYNPPP